MGIRDEELMRADSTGTASNPDALRSRQPAAGLADTVSQRAVPPDAGTAPRAAFGSQPGAALSEATNARLGPPTPSPIRMGAQQPGAALASAAQARAGADTLAAAQPRSAYLLGGAEPPPAPKPQTPALFNPPPGADGGAAARQAFASQPGSALADAAAARQNSALPGNATARDPRVAFNAQPGQAVADASAARNAAPVPGAAPVEPANARAAYSARQPGAALANVAGGRNPIQGPPVPPSVSPPLTPDQLPGTAARPNVNTGGAGAMSQEAMDWKAGRQAFAGPTQNGVPLAPAAQGADKAGMVARMRAAMGLGGSSPAAAGQPGVGARIAGAAGKVADAAAPVVGSQSDWANWAANAKTAAANSKTLGVVKAAGRLAGKVAPPLAAAGGVMETAQGLSQGDMGKAGMGALDTAAAAGLYTPAAPAAGTYLAIRGGYQAGQSLPEKVRDAIGGTMNSVAQWFGGGTDDMAYLRSEAAYDARQAAKAQPAANVAKAPPPAAKSAPKTVAAAAAPVAAPAPAPAPRAPAAPAGPDMSAVVDRYNGLQSQLDASPIARVVLGGGGSGVYYKDGTVLPLQPGQALPDDVQQHLSIGNAMAQIENGQYRMPATAAPAPAGGSDKAAAFAAQYGPAVSLAAQRIGVDPNLLLAQFGHETGWGQSIVPGTNNLGNIKDLSGKGVGATDNMTGSKDKYMQFATPEAFADHYADLITRKYPGAVGAGSDMQQFAAALKQGGYAQDPNYVNGLMGAYNTLGSINRSSSTPMQSPAVVSLDGEAPPAAAPARAGVPATAPGAPLPFTRGPVQILRGMQDSTALPNAGGGYTEVPTDVYQAGVRGGNASLAGRGPIGDYAANLAQGAGFAANPVGGKLAEEALRNQGAERVANIGLEGHKVSAQAQRDVEDMKAKTARNTVFYNEEQVGTDSLNNPIIKKVPYMIGEDGQRQRLAPEQKTWPIPNKDAIKELEDTGNAPAFDAVFGPGAAAKFSKQKG